ncbi:MAG TPA: polysaccharide biosynthesis C-terminal domain-containing protein [Chitinophagaceae bacterium]|jgi:O-antigen/teichoic acid export membrane protein|nr:polysaccharide biosynthesis C-terminal domain-containing protein [Chitinophagaceae bacterium]
MSHSKFYSSLLLLILLNVIIKPIWIFGIDRQVQNITGVTEYGTYFSLLNLSIVFGFLLDWGLSNFINRELAAKKTSLQQQLGSFLTLKLLFAIFYALVVTAIAMLSGVKRWDILGGVIIIQFLTFLFVFLRSIVTANQWFRADAWLSVLDKMLMIVICSAFIFWPVFFGSITIKKFLAAQIFSTIIVIIFVFIILSFKGVVIKKPTLKFFNRSILFAALPFAITIFIMSIHVRLDGFLLERMHSKGAYEAGIYAAAYRLLDASNMVGFLISSFFMPFVARLWSEGKPLQQLILQTRHMQLMFAITIVAITIMLAPWLQQILYHRHDEYSVQILQWCLPALIGYALVQVYGTVMTATGSIVSFCYLNAGAVAINVMMNLFLIPQYGAFGCCISALSSQLLLGIATMFFVHKKLRISADVRSIIIYLLNGLTIIAMLYGLSKVSVTIWLLLVVAICITFVFMWLSKMISLNNWLSFLKKQ